MSDHQKEFALQGNISKGKLIAAPPGVVKLAVSKREASSITSLSIRTIENLIAAKRLPARRVGRRVLLLVRDLEAFLRRDHPTQEIPAAQDKP